MKILVFSDSHRSRSGMYKAIDAHNPDQILHLGDLVEDAEEVTYLYPTLPVCMVPGNCDGWTTMPAKNKATGLPISGRETCSIMTAPKP